MAAVTDHDLAVALLNKRHEDNPEDNFVNSVLTGLAKYGHLTEKQVKAVLAPREDRKPSEWVGEEGDEVGPLEVTLLYVGGYSNDKPFRFVIMVDEWGNVYKTSSRGKFSYEAAQRGKGGKITMKGVVGTGNPEKYPAHVEYNGTKQTVLSDVYLGDDEIGQ